MKMKYPHLPRGMVLCPPLPLILLLLARISSLFLFAFLFISFHFQCKKKKEIWGRLSYAMKYASTLLEEVNSDFRVSFNLEILEIISKTPLQRNVDCLEFCVEN
ncbi:unnamed protein product, partial [Cuscuta epithymum]